MLDLFIRHLFTISYTLKTKKTKSYDIFEEFTPA